MTVQELMQILSGLDPDLPVVVAGYERGFNDVTQVKPVSIMLNVNSEWYYGSHDLSQNAENDDKSTPLIPAIFLGGTNPHATEPDHRNPFA
jgi:hypothetical protein